MQTVGVRELVNRASALLDQVQEDEQPIVVTRHGRPVAVLSAIDKSAIDKEAFYDFVLEQAPEFAAGRTAAEQEIAAGNLGAPLADVIAELDVEET